MSISLGLSYTNLAMINKKEWPMVSIIVPVYNDSKGIKRCLESLISQSYPHENYEVIVVDNNSNDNTKGTIKSFSKDGVIYAQENQRQSSYFFLLLSCFYKLRILVSLGGVITFSWGLLCFCKAGLVFLF